VEFKGFVGRINTKSGDGWTLYSAKIQKADGSEYKEWVSFGFEEQFEAFNVKEGDYVKIETQNIKGNERAQTVKKLKNPPEKPAPVERNSGGNSGFKGNKGGKKFDGSGIQNRTNPVDVERMSYANARDAAIKVVALLLSEKALPLSKADTKAGEQKRFAEITAMIDKLTVQFQKDGVSLRVLESVADSRVAAKEPAPLPDDSEEEEELDEEEETEEEEEEE
jgi:hypothetical protein